MTSRPIAPAVFVVPPQEEDAIAGEHSSPFELRGLRSACLSIALVRAAERAQSGGQDEKLSRSAGAAPEHRPTRGVDRKP
jgi:hypothetical protein